MNLIFLKDKKKARHLYRSKITQLCSNFNLAFKDIYSNEGKLFHKIHRIR